MFSILLRHPRCNTAQARSILTASVRRYASRTQPIAPRSAPSALATGPPPRSKPSARPTTGSLLQYKKLMRVEMAEQLYELGTKRVYRAGKRLTIFRIQCWSISAVCMGVVFWYFSDHMLDYRVTVKERGLPRAVFAGLWMSALFCCLVPVFLIRYAGGNVHAIDLIKRSDQVFLQLSIRGTLPFYKYKRTIRPYDIRADLRTVAWRNIPAWMISKKLNESSPSAAIGSAIASIPTQVARGFWHIYGATKQLFEQAGIVKLDFVVTEGKEERIERYNIDLDGEYVFLSNDLHKPAIWEMVVVRDPKNPDID